MLGFRSSGTRRYVVENHLPRSTASHPSSSSPKTPAATASNLAHSLRIQLITYIGMFYTHTYHATQTKRRRYAFKIQPQLPVTTENEPNRKYLCACITGTYHGLPPTTEKSLRTDYRCLGSVSITSCQPSHSTICAGKSSTEGQWL